MKRMELVKHDEHSVSNPVFRRGAAADELHKPSVFGGETHDAFIAGYGHRVYQQQHLRVFLDWHGVIITNILQFMVKQFAIFF